MAAAATGTGSTRSTLVQDTLDLVEPGLQEFEHANSGKLFGRSVILIGETGVGKSTLINLLAGVTLKAQYDDDLGETSIRAERPLPHFRIGHSAASETTFPRHHTIGEVTFWDTPGLNDNRGTAQQVANAICMKKVFERSQGVKLLVVTTERDLIQSRAAPLTSLVSALNQLLPEQSHKIKGSVSLVVTGTHPLRTPSQIAESIRRAINEQQLENAQELTLLEALRAQPICLFKRPDSDSIELDTSETKSVLIRNLAQINYAEGLTAEISLSSRSIAIIQASYNELHTEISTLINQFNAHFNRSIETATAPFLGASLTQSPAQRKAAHKTFEDIAQKMQGLEQQEYSIETLPNLVQACVEIITLCNGSANDALSALLSKVKSFEVLEQYVTQNTRLSCDVIKGIKGPVLESRNKVESALVRIQAKAKEEEAAAEAERAQKARNEAEAAARRRRAAEQERARLLQQQRQRQRQKCGRRRRKHC